MHIHDEWNLLFLGNPVNDQIKHNNSDEKLGRSNQENKEYVEDKEWCSKHMTIASFGSITSSSSSSAGYANSIESMDI